MIQFNRSNQRLFLMKNTFLLLLFCLASLATQAQFGFTYTRNILSSDGLPNQLESESGFPNGYEISVDYQQKFNGLRIELLPEIGYVNHRALGLGSGKYSMQSFLTQLNVNIYPFDLDGDCDCPTWGRDGGIFEKGFFVQATGGYGWNSINYNLNQGSLFGMGNSSAFFGGAVGLDIGIFKEITITPMVAYHYFVQNSFLEPIDNPIMTANSPYGELTFGLRLGFWLKN